jgi:ABC-2 type transport system permease protein
VSGFVRQALAFARRDFVTDFTYRLSFAIGVANAAFAVGTYYFLSRLIGGQPGGYDAFAFLLTGVVLNGAASAAIACYALAIRDAQQTGTLPVLVVSPVSAARLIALSSAYPMLRAVIEGTIDLFAGVLLGLSLSSANVPGAVLVFALSMAAFSALGVLSAACIVVWKRGDPIPWLIGAASWLLGGVFYPVDQLPSWLQGFSWFLPITYALEALRPALLGGVGFVEVLRRATPLLLLAAVLVPSSLLAFTWAIERARREGTLRQY